MRLTVKKETRIISSRCFSWISTASLSYLQNLPVDALKIDRSFIQRIGDQDESIAIIKAIDSLARSLNIGVIAEEVENREQYVKLDSMRCELMQGYYFSRPISGQQMESLLRRGISDLDGKLSLSTQC